MRQQRRIVKHEALSRYFIHQENKEEDHAQAAEKYARSIFAKGCTCQCVQNRYAAGNVSDGLPICWMDETQDGDQQEIK